MIAQGIVHSFLLEVLRGVHQPGDDYRLALYTTDAQLGPMTTAYLTAGEVRGNGYTPGGKSLTGYVADEEEGIAFLNWDNPTWPHSTIVARAALIYNATRQNRAVAVLDMGGNYTSTNGPFTVNLPAPTAATALIAIGYL